MVTNAHTPGPWRVSDLGGCVVGPVRIVRDQGGDVPQLQSVARVSYRFNETEANTRLMAAAPDMLAALNEVASHADDECGFMALVRAAIAKAEGRS